jgi:hypothetical protein
MTDLSELINVIVAVGAVLSLALGVIAGAQR